MARLTQADKEMITKLGLHIKERDNYSILGGKILVFGDLHLSSTYEGHHKNYFSDCMDVMSRIKKRVEEEKPTAVIFLGDIVGVQERVLRDRPFLTEVIKFFRYLNDLTKNNVYVVKGNHDIADYSDFDLLVDIGLIKNPEYLDFFGAAEDDLVSRIHFVNYGEEDKRLIIPEDSGFTNIVVCHNDIQISGVTTWYMPTKGAKDLSTMKNWKDVNLVIAGHIHNPSKEVQFTAIENNSIGLFYPGCPTRVATSEKYDSCFILNLEFDKDEDSIIYDAVPFELKPYDEVFYPDEDFVNEKSEETLEDIKNASLVSIVQEIMDGKIMSGDLYTQIRKVPGASDRVKDIACEYLKKAIDVKS